MRIHRLDAGTIVLEEIDDLVCELLQQIPASADPSGSDAARDRLYPVPSGGADPEADAE